MHRLVAPLALAIAVAVALGAGAPLLGDPGVQSANAGVSFTATPTTAATATATTAATATATTAATATATTVPTAGSTTADLVLAVSASPNPVAAGQVMSYFITVLNAGGVLSGTTSVIGQVPAGTTVYSLGTGCFEDSFNHLFRCQVLPIGPGGQTSISINLNVTANSGFITNHFAVDSENAVAESNEANNVVDLNVQVLFTTPVPGATATPIPPTSTPAVISPPPPPPVQPEPTLAPPIPAPPTATPEPPPPPPAPEPAPAPPEAQLWALVLAETPAYNDAGDVIFYAEPGEWYLVVTIDDGWALTVWEGDPPESTEWLFIDENVELDSF